MLDQGQMSKIRICVHLNNTLITMQYMTIYLFPAEVLSGWSKVRHLALYISAEQVS